jgi:hypothetical protein
MVRDVRSGDLTFPDGEGIEVEFLSRLTGITPGPDEGVEAFFPQINPDNLELILEFLAEYVIPIILMLLENL